MSASSKKQEPLAGVREENDENMSDFVSSNASNKISGSKGVYLEPFIPIKKPFVKRASLATIEKRLSQSSFLSHESKHNDVDTTPRPASSIQNGQKFVACTYKLGPGDKEIFNSSKAEMLIMALLKSHLDGKQYDQKTCGNLSKSLTDLVKNKIKEMTFHRYKIVCSVIIGEHSRQACQIASRCLWNADTDRYASVHYSNGKLFAIANVYATYFE